MKERGISTYNLEYEYMLNPAEISRLKHNHNFTMSTLDRYCGLFHCEVKELIVYVPD
ncbi:helix-turn-helix domain-containing protein [Butyricicoccus pullicaecorum]